MIQNLMFFCRYEDHPAEKSTKKSIEKDTDSRTMSSKKEK